MTKKKNKRRIDYFAIDVPDGDPQEFTYAERRADLLRRTLDVGDPQMISRTKAAGRYGVSIGQITQDMQRIARFLSENIDGKQYTFRLQTAFNKIYDRFMEEGKYMKAWNLIRDWGRFLFETGRMEREPDKIDLSGGFEINIERFDGKDDDDDLDGLETK